MQSSHPPPPPHPTSGRSIDPAPGKPGDPVATLVAYEATLAGLRAALVDAHTSPSYLMLTSGTLEGETARRFPDAAARDAALWPLLDALGVATSAAREVADRSGVFGPDTDEIRRLVSASWVPADGLQGSAGRLFSMAELVAEIRARLDPLIEGVSAVDHIWFEALPQIDAATRTLDRLEREASTLDVREPLIGRARALAADLQLRLTSDPLGIAAADPANLDRQVAAAADQMANLRAGHDALAGDLAATESILSELRLLRSQAAAARVAAEQKVDQPDGLITPPGPGVIDGPGGLAAQLDALFEGTQGWTQRRTLLDGWLRSTERLRRQLERAKAANRRPLDRRDELRGRFTAYRAKMAAMGRSEDIALMDLTDRVQRELGADGADLDGAETLIDLLAEALRS